MDVINDVGYDLEKVKRDFNVKNLFIDDQVYYWCLQFILFNILVMGFVSYMVECEEIFNEVCKRMKSDEDVYQVNNYYLVILYVMEN